MADIPFQEFMGLSDAEYADFQRAARKAGMSEREFWDMVWKRYKEENPLPEQGIDIGDYIVPKETLDDIKRAEAVERLYQATKKPKR